jgi:hypothetical protein
MRVKGQISIPHVKFVMVKLALVSYILANFRNKLLRHPVPPTEIRVRNHLNKNQ